MQSLLLIALILVSQSTLAYSAWVDRYTNCQKAIHSFPDPGPQVTAFIFANGPVVKKDDIPVFEKWGDVTAYPGVNGGEAGVWVIGKGNAYFSPFPKGESSHLKITPNLDLSSTEWRIKISPPDRPALYLRVSRNESITAIKIFPRIDDESEFTANSVTPLVSDEARDPLPAIIKKRITWASSNPHTRDFAKSLSQCKEGLNPNDPIDADLIGFINEMLKKRTIPNTPQDHGTNAVKERDA